MFKDSCILLHAFTSHSTLLDSMYKTYQANPKAIAQGLEKVGARMIGTRGEINASDDEDKRTKDINIWMGSLLSEISDLMEMDPPELEILVGAKANCRIIST